MPTLDKYRLRLELELAQGIAAAPVNLFTGAAPVFPRSRDLQWEIVLLNNGALDSSVGNITSMVLEVKTFQSPASAPLISVAISGAALNTNLTDGGRPDLLQQGADRRDVRRLPQAIQRSRRGPHAHQPRRPMDAPLRRGRRG